MATTINMSSPATQDPIAAIAMQAVQTHLASPAAMEVITTAVKTTVNRAIADSLSVHSPFGKQVAEAVNKCLALHGEIDLPSYNHTLLAIIAAQVEAATKDSIEKQVAERMKDLLTPAPAEIKLSELVEQYREYLKERRNGGCICDSSEQFMFRIERDKDATTVRFVNVNLSEDEDDRDPDVRFGVILRNGESAGEIYTLQFRDARGVERKIFVGPLYGFQRSLFQMKAAKTRVVIDVEQDDVDTSYANSND